MKKTREVGSLEIVRYSYNGDKIEIEMIKVLDKEGCYIKFAKLKDVLPYLSKFPVTFKELKND